MFLNKVDIEYGLIIRQDSKFRERCRGGSCIEKGFVC